MSEISKLNGYDIKDKKSVRTYESIADMIADTSLKEGQHIKTRGYYIASDGGGAEYLIVDNNLLTEDKGSIIDLDNELKAVLIFDDTINVRHFGAKGNNTDDDTNSFIAYINYCNANTKNIHIPIGKYLIYNDLPELKMNIAIIGELGTSGIDVGSSTRPVIYDYRDSSEYLIRYNQNPTNKHGASIYNVTFVGKSYFNQDRYYQHNCINFRVGAYKSVIKNVVISQYEQALLVNNSDETIIENVNIFHCGGTEDNSTKYAVEIKDTNGVILRDCVMEHNRFAIKGDEGNSAFIMDSCYVEMVSQIGWKGTSPILLKNGKISNNYFTTRPIDTIATAMSDTIDNVYYYLTVGDNTTLSNNIFGVGGWNSSVVDDNKLQGKFIYIYNVNNVVITDNTFKNCAFETPAINFRSSYGLIDNNTFDIRIEEEITSENDLIGKYVINNQYSMLFGHNRYNVYNYVINGSDALPSIPNFCRNTDLSYDLMSFHKTSSSMANDVYKYGNNTNFANIPTMIIQSTRNTIELEIREMGDSTGNNGLYYKGYITYNINGSSTTFTEEGNSIKKMSGATINFIKKADKLYIQILNKTNKYFYFKVNKSTAYGLVYNKNTSTQESEGIIGSITSE